MVKRPPLVVAKTFNSGEASRKSRAEYDLAMQDSVDAQDEKIRCFLESKAKARKGKKRGKVADADGYFFLPIELMRLLDEHL